MLNYFARTREEALKKADESGSRDEQNKHCSQAISITFDDISLCIQV